MKKFLVFITLLLLHLSCYAGEWIRVNQLGYLPQSVKVGVYISDELHQISSFALIDAFTKKEVYSFSEEKIHKVPEYGQMKACYRLDFSDVEEEGVYYIKVNETLSPRILINTHVYDGTADFALNYMRQQRCGFNPFLNDSCHSDDGYIEFHPQKSGQHIDVRGGWHDAADYLQYTTTSANAIYQMLFAYEQNPESFADYFDASGRKGKNGIPDIIDEIKWGLEWLCRMNPEPGQYYNQIADDRDHAGMRSPSKDQVDYGYGSGKGRSVYFCSGEVQPRGKTGLTNFTTGVASTTGKFASCFSLGGRILKAFYPDFAADLLSRAEDAYKMGVMKPGVCQTASRVSPYIYEEDNWTDDMELAALELYGQTNKEEFLSQGLEYARREPITPWMGADSARHYQWYPFVNLGHYRLASQSSTQKEFLLNMRSGISRTYEKAKESAFLNGIPFIWCSNNLCVAMLTQCRLYRELSGDNQFKEMEAALLDWLFGCNPWGTSMIVELPLWGNFPSQPHSSYVKLGLGNTTGGLVDGPVYSSIYNSLIGISLSGLPNLPAKPYTEFQPNRMVYHDAIGDYSTNEPTMDGTASLTYYLSSLQKEGMLQRDEKYHDNHVWVDGGIIRTNPKKKTIALVFTAADKRDGEDYIINTLKKHGIKAGFFFTGEFYEKFPDTIQRLLHEGHYVGSHSYGHLLYMPWENRDSLLASQSEFENDMEKSFSLLEKACIHYKDAKYFIPPYEYYNQTISSWAKGMGLQVVNFTPGTLSNADYTTPDMSNYRSSKVIFDRILTMEKNEGLNGHIMLFHFGTDNSRTDKFYKGYLDKLINHLKKKGYSFVSLKDAIEK